MKTYTPNYITYISPLAGMLGILVFFPIFLFVTFTYNDWTYILITLVVLLLLFITLNYINIKVKKVIIKNNTLFINNDAFKFEEIHNIKLTKIYTNLTLFEVKAKSVKEMKNSWLSVVGGGWRRAGEIRHYLEINSNGSSKEYLLTGYSKQSIQLIKENLKDTLDNKFEFEDFLQKQGLKNTYLND